MIHHWNQNQKTTNQIEYAESRYGCIVGYRKALTEYVTLLIATKRQQNNKWIFVQASVNHAN